METTILIKQEAFVYKIPPQQNSSSGFKANGWTLDKVCVIMKLKVIIYEMCFCNTSDRYFLAGLVWKIETGFNGKGVLYQIGGEGDRKALRTKPR